MSWQAERHKSFNWGSLFLGEVQILCEHWDNGRHFFLFWHRFGIGLKLVGHLVIDSRKNPHQINVCRSKTLHLVSQRLNKPRTMLAVSPCKVTYSTNIVTVTCWDMITPCIKLCVTNSFKPSYLQEFFLNK